MSSGPKVRSKGKKKRSERPRSKKWEAFKIEGNRLVRVKKICPKCGAGVYLAQHSDRESCGKCGYAQYNKKS